MSEVGLIGLGSIGGIYAEHLLKKWSHVVVSDQDEARIRELVAIGAESVDSPSELGEKCATVLVSLPSPAALKDAIIGVGTKPGAALLDGMETGGVIIDASTVDPGTSRFVYAEARARGVSYLDAPVSGGAPMEGGTDAARAASLTWMVGGDYEAFERAKAVFEALGRKAFYLGPPGSGSTVKIISNLVSGIYTIVVAEAFALGAAAGFSPDVLAGVFQETDAKSYFMTDYLVPRLQREDYAPGFKVQLQLKDHRLAEQLGKDLGIPLALNDEAVRFYESMCADRRGGNDVVDAVRYLAELCNIEPRPVMTKREPYSREPRPGPFGPTTMEGKT